jgi:hypothetical protein
MQGVAIIIGATWAKSVMSGTYLVAAGGWCLLLKGIPIEFLMKIVMRSCWEHRIRHVTRIMAIGSGKWE